MDVIKFDWYDTDWMGVEVPLDSYNGRAWYRVTDVSVAWSGERTFTLTCFRTKRVDVCVGDTCEMDEHKLWGYYIVALTEAYDVASYYAGLSGG